MRAPRFLTWLTDLLTSDLPDGVTLVSWTDAGVTGEAGMEHTTGVVLQAPDGGAAYLQIVHGGGRYDGEEKIVEGNPPAPVAPVSLVVQPGGQLRMVDVEAWITAAIVNSQSRELATVERYSTREKSGAHPFGFNITWHSGASTHAHLLYTLRPGERRGADTRYRVLETV